MLNRAARQAGSQADPVAMMISPTAVPIIMPYSLSTRTDSGNGVEEPGGNQVR